MATSLFRHDPIMKFQQFPLGARFEFEGKVYVKTGPISAASEQGGQRMIPRYAMLRPLDGPAPVAAPKPARNLNGTAVLTAFEAFYSECGRLLEGNVDNASKLEMARGRFLTALGMDADAKS